MPSPIVQTTAEQVMVGIEPASRYAIKGLIEIDAETLRVHVKLGRRVLNTDIRYDRGPDTYTVTRHRDWNGTTFQTTTTIEGVYCDQLSELCLDPE